MKDLGISGFSGFEFRDLEGFGGIWSDLGFVGFGFRDLGLRGLGLGV